MRVPWLIVGTLCGGLGAALVCPALKDESVPILLCGASTPVAIGFVIGLLIDSNQESKPRWLPRLHPAVWWATALVAWGNWNAQTASFPLNEHQARPSWFVYGWPVCFGTSGRGRFNFVDFSATVLGFDLACSAVMVACSVFAANALICCFPRLTIRCIFAILGGVAFACAVWSGNLAWIVHALLGADPPAAGMSAMAGDTQLPSRLTPFVFTPLTVGLFCMGFTFVELVFALIYRLEHPHKKRHSIGCRGL